MVGIGHARSLAILDTMVLCHLLFAIEKDDSIFVGAHFELTAKQRRRRGIAIARETNEALDIDDTAVQRVHLGDINWLRSQCGPLGGPKLDGPGFQSFAELTVLAFAPGARLLV